MEHSIDIEGWERVAVARRARVQGSRMIGIGSLQSAWGRRSVVGWGTVGRLPLWRIWACDEMRAQSTREEPQLD